MRGKRLLALLAAMFIAVGVAACGGSSDSSGGSGSEDGPIKIGVASAKTGFMSPFDIPALVGAEMAVEDINADGGVLGRDLELVHVDSKSDKEQAANAATQLISNDNVDMIIPSCDFDYGGPAALVAQGEDLLAIGCGTDVKFGAKGIGPNVFTLTNYTNGEGAAAAEWAYESKGWKTVYTLTDQSIDYSKSLGKYFEERWAQLAGADSILGKDTFQGDDASFAAQISRIKDLPKQPDFIYMPSCPPGATTAVRQIRAAGIEIPIVNGVCIDGDAWMKGMKDLSNVYYTPWVSAWGNDPNPDVNKLIKRVSESPENPDLKQYSVVGYSIIEAYARAVEEAGSTDTEAVRKALESFEDEDLLVGPTTFTTELHGTEKRPYAVVEIRNGNHEYVEPWAPKDPPPAGL